MRETRWQRAWQGSVRRPHQRRGPWTGCSDTLLRDADQDVVILCNEGSASPLAVAQLEEPGLHRVADLIGGYRAWLADGLPTA